MFKTFLMASLLTMILPAAHSAVDCKKILEPHIFRTPSALLPPAYILVEQQPGKFIRLDQRKVLEQQLSKMSFAEQVDQASLFLSYVALRAHLFKSTLGYIPKPVSEWRAQQVHTSIEILNMIGMSLSILSQFDFFSESHKASPTKSAQSSIKEVLELLELGIDAYEKNMAKYKATRGLEINHEDWRASISYLEKAADVYEKQTLPLLNAYIQEKLK